MPLRNLHRKSKPYRYIGYWVVALLIVILGEQQRSVQQLIVGVVYCSLWPIVCAAWLDWKKWLNEKSSTTWALRTQVTEHFLAGMLVGFCSLPALLSLTIVVSLLSGSVALAGKKFLRWCVPAHLAGIGAGVTLSPVLTFASSYLVDTASVMLILGYFVLLSDAGFRQAQRLHETRQALIQQVQEREALVRRLIRYLPADLGQQLQHHPDQPLPLKRTWLTVGFVDLMDFCALSERLQPEELSLILNDYLDLVTVKVVAEQGIVAKVTGDGVLVYFAGDRARAVRRCVRAMRNLIKALPMLHIKWAGEGVVVNLGLRSGIAAGYCTLGDWGSTRLEYTAIGSVVNLAHRLQQSAQANKVLVCNACQSLLSDSAKTHRSQVQLKGLGSVSCFEV